MVEKVKRIDKYGRNVQLLEDCITDYVVRAKTLITELNATLGLNNPRSQILVNPFAIDQTCFMNNDMSLEGQLSSFLTKGFSYWHSVIGTEYSGQNSDTFVPSTEFMIKFWNNASVLASFPNLCTIVSHVSVSTDKIFK